MLQKIYLSDLTFDKSPEITFANFFEGPSVDFTRSDIVALSENDFLFLSTPYPYNSLNAYVLSDSGVLIGGSENISLQSDDRGISHITAIGSDADYAYFSYQTYVFSGYSSPHLKIAKLNLNDFSLNEIYGVDQFSLYDWGGVNLPSYAVSKLNDKQLYVAESFNYFSENNNYIKKIDAFDGTFEIIANLDYNITSLSVSNGIIAATYNTNLEHYKKADLVVTFIDAATGLTINTVTLDTERNNHVSSDVLSNGDFAFAFSQHLDRTVEMKIFSVNDTTLKSNLEFESTYNADAPSIEATTDGGFLLSFIYQDKSVYNSPDYVNQQVVIRYNAAFEPILDTLAAVSPGYHQKSVVASNNDGEMLGVWERGGEPEGYVATAFSSRLYGSDGDDTIVGGAGNNIIFSGRGNDILTGGTGADVFVIDSVSGANRVTDFNIAEDSFVFVDYVGDPIEVSLVSTKIVGNDLLYSLHDGANLLFEDIKPAEFIAKIKVDTAFRSETNVSVSEVSLLRSDETSVMYFSDEGAVSFEKEFGSTISLSAYYGYDADSRSITSQDALDALRLAVGLHTSAGTKLAFDYVSADINEDGKVTSSDALEILKFSVGLPAEHHAKWVFLDRNADYSEIGKDNTNYSNLVTLEDISADTSINFIGVLIGDVNNSYNDFIA